MENLMFSKYLHTFIIILFSFPKKLTNHLNLIHVKIAVNRFTIRQHGRRF